MSTNDGPLLMRVLHVPDDMVKTVQTALRVRAHALVLDGEHHKDVRELQYARAKSLRELADRLND